MVEESLAKERETARPGFDTTASYANRTLQHTLMDTEQPAPLGTRPCPPFLLPAQGYETGVHAPVALTSSEPDQS